jgi:hypothetical protein
MHELATGQDQRRNAGADAGDLPAPSALGVPAAAGGMRAARAGKSFGKSREGKVARLIRVTRRTK